MWKESEEIFKWKKDRQFFELFNKDESSHGSQYLLETVSEEGSSIASLSWSMRSWLSGVWCFVRTVNLILDPWFVLKSSSLEISIFKALYAIPHWRAFLQKFIYRFVDLFYYILCAPKYGIYHIVLHDGYSQLLLQILHGNLVTIVNYWKSRLAVYSTVGKEY